MPSPACIWQLTDSSGGLGASLAFHPVLPEHKWAHFAKTLTSRSNRPPRLPPRDALAPHRAQRDVLTPKGHSFHRWVSCGPGRRKMHSRVEVTAGSEVALELGPLGGWQSVRGSGGSGSLWERWLALCGGMRLPPHRPQRGCDAHCVSGAAGILHGSHHSILAIRGVPVVTPVLQMVRLRLREGQEACKGQSPPNLRDSGHFYCAVRSQSTRVQSQLWDRLDLLPDLPGPALSFPIGKWRSNDIYLALALGQRLARCPRRGSPRTAPGVSGSLSVSLAGPSLSLAGWLSGSPAGSPLPLGLRPRVPVPLPVPSWPGPGESAGGGRTRGARGAGGGERVCPRRGALILGPRRHRVNPGRGNEPPHTALSKHTPALAPAVNI